MVREPHAVQPWLVTGPRHTPQGVSQSVLVQLSDDSEAISEPSIPTRPLERHLARRYAMLLVDARLAVARQPGVAATGDQREPRLESRSALRRAVDLDRLNEIQEALHAR
jgi:hypothetical protein